MVVTIVRATPGAGKIQVAAQVNDIVEDGGTCILTATNAAAHLTVSSQAFANSQSTVCGELSLSSVQAGAWDVSVTYTSARHYGVSDPMRVGVS